MKIREAIDNIFSHNEIVDIWRPEDRDHDKRVWHGMAWELPDKYLDAEDWKIFGLISESVYESDHINIRIK